jgi:aspartate beta-hydroxylase
MMLRDWTGARESLEGAIAIDPSLPVLWVNLAAVFYSLKLEKEEKAALDKALALDPRNLRALLQAGLFHETREDSRAAAAIYRTALQSVPRGVELPQAMTAHLQHAVKVVELNSRALETFLDERLKDVRARHDGQSLRRFDICMAMALQKQPIYRSRPSFLYFPELPTIEFHDRAQFAWLDQIEAATDDIRAEFLKVFAEDSQRLEPYVGDVSDIDIWRELSNSSRWSVYNLWKAGTECVENLARCPRTAEALEAWPKTDLRGSGPSAVFSILDAKTRIPPHSGVHNSRLIVHLPLVIPPDCWFRVGSTTREWQEGKALIFDDSIEHEAWNGSDVPRAVMIFDIWNPNVTEAERDLVSALTDGIGAFYGSLPSYV